MKKGKRKILTGACLLAAFVIWTVLVGIVDVQPIGPDGSRVGFATVNGFVHGVEFVNGFAYYKIILIVWDVLAAGGLGFMGYIVYKKIKKPDEELPVNEAEEIKEN